MIIGCIKRTNNRNHIIEWWIHPILMHPNINYMTYILVYIYINMYKDIYYQRFRCKEKALPFSSWYIHSVISGLLSGTMSAFMRLRQRWCIYEANKSSIYGEKSLRDHPGSEVTGYITVMRVLLFVVEGFIMFQGLRRVIVDMHSRIRINLSSVKVKTWMSNHKSYGLWNVIPSPRTPFNDDIIKPLLSHWGRVTHICVCKLTINGSDNGQAIIWTNARIL